MTKIKKVLNLKIMLVVISILFLSNATLYSYPVSKDILRVPVGQQGSYERIRNAQKEVVLLDYLDTVISGVSLRTRGKIPDKLLERIALAVSEAHSENPIISSNCKKCSELFVEKAKDKLGNEHATIIGSPNLYAKHDNIDYPDNWKKAAIGWGNHWVGYIVVEGLHIAVDLTAKGYLIDDGIDAEIIVGTSRESLEKKLMAYYGGTKWETLKEKEANLALQEEEVIHEVVVGGTMLDLRDFRNQKIRVSFADQNGEIQEPIVGKLIDYYVNTEEEEIELVLNTGGTNMKYATLKNRPLTEKEKSDPWESAMPLKIVISIQIDSDLKTGREILGTRNDFRAKNSSL